MGKGKKNTNKKTGNPLILPVMSLIISSIAMTLVIIRLIITILRCIGKI